MKKIAVVTGASQGIGEHIAENFAERGYDLILCARNLELLEQLKLRLQKAYSVKAECVKADLSSESGVLQLTKFCEPYFADIEVLVNNAGFGDGSTFANQKWEVFHEMLELNIVTLTKLTHIFANQFVKNKRGSILNVASTAAFQPVPLFAVYAASKSFVLSFSQAVREELGEQNVNVSVLCPGATATAFHVRAGTDKIFSKNFTMLDVKLVARIGVQGMLAKKAIIVPGFTNRMMIFSQRLSPRGIVVKFAKQMMSKN